MKSWIQIAFRGLWAYFGICFVSSCIDGNVELPGPNGRGEEGYLSFRLHTHSADILSSTSTDYGTVEERKVSKIYMLLYDGGGKTGTLRKKTEIHATNTSGTFAGEDVVNRSNIKPGESTFVIKAIPLEKKNYQLIMLMNPTPAILARTTENTSTVGDMLTAVTDTGVSDYQTTDGQFMTNAGGVVQIVESQIKEGAILAEEDPIVVPVERIMAKVFVFENRNKKLTEVATGGTIESVHWALDVTNKQTYLVRQQDKLKDGTIESIFITDRSLVYAKDPNFTGNETIINSEQERNKHFTILDPLASTSFQPWNAYNKPTDYYQYILENTVSQADQNATGINPSAYLTQVVLKAIIKNPGKVITGNDYYTFSYINSQSKHEWKAFTHAQAVEWFNGTYPSDMPASLHQALVEAQTQNGSPFKFQIENQILPSSPGGYATAKTTQGQVTFHKAGLNIYRIPIRHFGAEDVAKTDYGYYGVVRNNTYNIIINSINGPGTNTPDEEYISSQIIVNPWFERGWAEDYTPIAL